VIVIKSRCDRRVGLAQVRRPAFPIKSMGGLDRSPRCSCTIPHDTAVFLAASRRHCWRPAAQVSTSSRAHREGWQAVVGSAEVNLPAEAITSCLPPQPRRSLEETAALIGRARVCSPGRCGITTRPTARPSALPSPTTPPCSAQRRGRPGWARCRFPATPSGSGFGSMGVTVKTARRDAKKP